MKLVRRWLPDRAIKLVGDGAYRVGELGTVCRKQQIEWSSGTALWYRGGQTPLPIRWVLTRDPEGKHEPRAYFSTNPAQFGLSILTDFMKRCCALVTFEESRAHLGVETQRQWSDKAIERMTPCL